MFIFQRAQLFATRAARLQEFRWPQETADVIGAILGCHDYTPYSCSRFSRTRITIFIPLTVSSAVEQRRAAERSLPSPARQAPRRQWGPPASHAFLPRPTAPGP